MKKPINSKKDIKKYIQESLENALDGKIVLYYIKDDKGVSGIYDNPKDANTAKSKHERYFEPTRGKGVLLTNTVSKKDYESGKINTSNIDRYKDASGSLEEKNEAPAKPTTTPPPTTTPVRRPNPIKIPRPGEYPKPAPKALKRLQEQFLKSWIDLEKKEIEKQRMKRLIQEAPMDIDGGGEQPHDSTRSSIEGNGQENPFSAIDLFSRKRLNQSTLEKIGSEEFNGIVRSLQGEQRLNMMQVGNLFNMILMVEVQHRPELEALSKNIVQRKFGLSDDIMDMIEAKLVNPGQVGEMGEPDNAEELAQYHFTPEELNIIKKHVDKRIIHNTLMMGAGYRAHKVFDELRNALDGINPRLYPMYKTIMPNMELFLWQMDVEEMFGQRVNLGKCEINDEGECKATAVIFPILLHEVAKGAVEILFLQHLADIQQQHGEMVARKVVKDADSYKDEHWLKLIGPQLWKYLHDALTFVVEEENEDYTIIAYVLNRMASMEPEAFMSLLDDTIHNGPAAIQKIKAILAQVRNDIDAFENQNNQQPTPEDITPDATNNEDEIAQLLAQNQDALLNTPANERPQPKSLEDMEIDELNNELQTALDLEDYNRAAQVRDVINRKRQR